MKITVKMDNIVHGWNESGTGSTDTFEYEKLEDLVGVPRHLANVDSITILSFDGDNPIVVADPDKFLDKIAKEVTNHDEAIQMESSRYQTEINTIEKRYGWFMDDMINHEVELAREVKNE
jgi:hypothetical protein